MIANIDQIVFSSLLTAINLPELWNTEHEETGSGCFWIILVGLRQILAGAADGFSPSLEFLVQTLLDESKHD